MRDTEPKFELFDITHVGAGNSIVGDVAGIGIARRVSTRQCKNSGNEAKNYLKTKDISFLNAANDARFACNLARISARNEQKQHYLRKRTEDFRGQGEVD